MDRNADSYYLHYEQFRKASKQRNRIQLHEKYRTYQYPWLMWVFDQLELESGMQVLEFGCGPGALWRYNQDRLPAAITFTLSDLSTGMVRTACENLPGDGSFRFLVADIQDAPLVADRFDAVITNHMLYHVHDLQRTIQSIYRVLKPGGVLFATTNGLRHMYNVFELILQVAPDIHIDTSAAHRFGLHNAAQRLAPAFTHVYVTVYPDFLWVTETEPLMDYIRTLWVATELSDAQMSRLAEIISNRIASEGGIHINKSSGLVKARRI